MDLVALAHEHVQHGLGADDLRGRRHQRDEAEVLAHLRDLREHLVETVGAPCSRSWFSMLVSMPPGT
jgi:hypothetical protein